jgi:hypothetical protein
VADARLYDGVDASAHKVVAEAEDGALLLTQPNGWSDRIDGALLKRLDAPRGELRLGRSDRTGWRLILPVEAQGDIATLLAHPERYGRWIDRIGLLPAAAIGALVTFAVVAAGYAAPRAIAPHVPASWERNVGAGLFGDFGSNRCRSSKGQKALEALLERIEPGSTTGPDAIRVAALDIPIYNAAALPGGYVVVFEPMITENDTEALAGVLAHEIAHLRRRHVTEALIRELGIGALIRLFAGDLGANAQQIVAMNYTRSNEREADADAIAMLRRANISPIPTAKLFKQLAKEEGEGTATGINAEFLRSHPLTLGRARLFEASARADHRYAPALDRDSDAALFDICKDKG